MRLGFPIQQTESVRAWIDAATANGMSAVYYPFAEAQADEAVAAAAAANILIAEVWAFGNNPISPDETIRRQGITQCQEKLALADRVGANCCVNIAGSRGEQWAEPHDDNMRDSTFDLIVESIREIIDAVQPTRTYYTLETMPWMYPDSAECYMKIIKAVDRERFAVHFDFVNLINCPERYYGNADFIQHCVALLGPHIKSVHVKDIRLLDKLTIHMDEVLPGTGIIDYGRVLKVLGTLSADLPLMIEHLPDITAYRQAAENIRSIASETGAMIQ